MVAMDSRTTVLRRINLALTLLGMLVFGGLLGGVMLFPSQWEAGARDFLVAEVSERANEARDAALRLAGEQAFLPPATLAAASAALEAAHHKLIEQIVADRCLFSCQQIDQLRQVLAQEFAIDQMRAELVIGTLREWSKDAYRERRDQLRRDILIMLGSNFAVMLLAFMLALLRKRAAPHLLPISSLLTLTTALASFWYVFGQNWFATLFYSSYFGWTYLALLLVIFLLLADIALNRGRVITNLINKACEGLLGGAQLNLC